MKVKINCGICEKEFKVNRGSHIKTCLDCRRSDNMTNFKTRYKIIVNKINSEFEMIKVYHSGGEFKITLDKKYFNLKNSINRVCNKTYYKKFIQDNIKLLENDLIKLKEYKFR